MSKFTVPEKLAALRNIRPVIVTTLPILDAVIADYEHLPALVEAAEWAKRHTDELRDAWEKGALASTDGFDAIRGDRNKTVQGKLKAALAHFTEAGGQGT